MFHMLSESRKQILHLHWEVFFRCEALTSRRLKSWDVYKVKKIHKIPPETDGVRNTQGRDGQKQKVQKGSKRQ